MMPTDAVACISAIWTRSAPRFSLDRLVIPRLEPIPDGGMWIGLGASLGAGYQVVPHFDARLPRMAGFHARFMASGRACGVDLLPDAFRVPG